MGTENSPMKVLMLPWLAFGHISPLLELAKKLSHRNTQTFLCSTPINLSSIKSKIPKKYSKSIHLLELHLPNLPELASSYHTTNGLPLHLHPTLKQTFDSSKQSVSRILETLKPDLLIHDIMIEWAPTMAVSCNIPAVAFLTSGAVMCSYFCHLLIYPDEPEYPFPAIKFTGVEFDMVNGFVQAYRTRGSTDDSGNFQSKIVLVNSSKSIDGKYIDYLSQVMRKKIVPVGQLVWTDDNDGDAADDTEIQENLETMEWLEKKDKFSTIFVSFGSEYFLKKEEIEEIAYGLEISEVNFIWVLRFPNGGEKTRVLEVLPKGFLERVGERGKVVEKWAPQAKILKHESVGGFVSHCGWNSILESIEFGVPMICMPMHLDQPFNAKFVEELGVGIGVGRDENWGYRRGEIGRVIRDVVGGEKGEVLRRRVEEVRRVLKEGCEEEFDGVVEELRGLCGKGRSSFLEG